MKPPFSASVIMIYVPSSVTELLHRDPEKPVCDVIKDVSVCRLSVLPAQNSPH